MPRKKTVICEGKTEVAPISKRAASRATPVSNLCLGLAVKKARLKYRHRSLRNVTTWDSVDFFCLAGYENRHMDPDPDWQPSWALGSSGRSPGPFQSRPYRRRRRAKAVLERQRWLKVNDGWKSNEYVSAATIQYRSWIKRIIAIIEIMLINSIINLKMHNKS